MFHFVMRFWKCLFSPRLYSIYGDGTSDSSYKPHCLERISDTVIYWAASVCRMGIYTGPLGILYFYRRGFLTTHVIQLVLNFFGYVGCIAVITMITRAWFRAFNQSYLRFLDALYAPSMDKAKYYDGIRKYDFDFSDWPVNYRVPQLEALQSENSLNVTPNSDLSSYQRLPIKILALIATHTFGIRMIYPGSVGIIMHLSWNFMIDGRARLVEVENGKRAKLQTADGNYIDSMFVDNRGVYAKGKMLVICCEGNCGFYEFGIMGTPLLEGYSVLGWNHPGFAESTGSPYPSQEHNAIDAVMQYAINELKFQPEEIIMYGWSIGGYSAVCAAANYPVQAVILDATFDDLLPLAKNQMPTSWSRLVEEVVRSHVNLHVAEMLKKYEGTVHLVRRTMDTIICLTPGDLGTNRGNHLVMNLINHRHPNVDEDCSKALVKFLNMVAAKRPSPDAKDLSSSERQALTLLSKYMSDDESTHCTMLSKKSFHDVMNLVVKNLK